jgi:hypothetical protein
LALSFGLPHSVTALELHANPCRCPWTRTSLKPRHAPQRQLQLERHPAASNISLSEPNTELLQLQTDQATTNLPKWFPQTPSTRHCKPRSKPPIPTPYIFKLTHPPPTAQRPPPAAQPKTHGRAPQQHHRARARPGRGPALVGRPAAHGPPLQADGARLPAVRLQPRRRQLPLAVEQPVRPAAGRGRRRRHRGRRQQ